MGFAHQTAEDAFIKAVTHDGVRIGTVAHFGRHIPAELRTALELGPLRALTASAAPSLAATAATAWNGTISSPWLTTG